MKQSEFIKAVMDGKTLSKGKYLTGMAEDRTWRDRESGREMNGKFCTHNVMVGQKVMMVSEDLPPGVKASEWKSPFQFNDDIVLEIDSIVNQKGALKARGKIQRLEPDDAPKRT
jgi:hypothetical protein